MILHFTLVLSMSFIVQSAGFKDQPALFRFALQHSLYNLPADRHLLRKKISESKKSFQGLLPKKDKNFVFVLKDLKKQGRVVGSSQLQSQYGSDKNPRLQLYLSHVKKKPALKLKVCKKPVSCLAGLVLDTSYHHHPQKLGRLISFIRFLFMASSPGVFQTQVYTEIKPFLNREKKAPFFEYFKKTQGDKNSHPLFLRKWAQRVFARPVLISDLPSEVQRVLGQTNPPGQRAMHILKKQNFVFKGGMHPVDSGPCLQAPVQKIPVIQNTKKVFLKAGALKVKGRWWLWGQTKNKNFKGGLLYGALAQKNLFISPGDFDTYNLHQGQEVFVSPFDL